MIAGRGDAVYWMDLLVPPRRTWLLQPRFPTPFSKLPPQVWLRRTRAAARWAAVLLCAAAWCPAAALPAHAAPVDPRLGPLLDAAGPGQTIPVWVLLRDKGPVGKAQPDVVSARSLRRRAKVRPAGALVDSQDMPVYEPYAAAIAAHSTRVRQRSKWLNAVSVDATRAQIDRLRALPGVRKIEFLTRFAAHAPAAVQPDAPAPPAPPSFKTGAAGERTHALDYGNSLTQNALVNVPAVHDLGYTGAGVLIAHFDNGHRLLSHQAFATLQVVAGRDFVDHDGNPAPPPNAPDTFGAHGIATLSVLAGFQPGQLIGPAYGAELALARTENDASETPVEEDNWVAAAEWADSLGADIVSSSVGYNFFDVPYEGHTWEDMDGNTAVITRAADWAAARGILVVNSAGNESFNSMHNTLLAPADADSCLTVGGVWTPPGATQPERYVTSSVGPTTSNPPRIKPDVVALGANVWFAGTTSPSAYTMNSGTSFACPMVAGVAALLLSAVPSATPAQLRDVLRATASHPNTPDNQTGWGIINAAAALQRLRSAVQPATFSGVKQRYR